MAATYSLIVRCNAGDKNRHVWPLRKLGMYWDQRAFYGVVKYGRYKKIAKYCRKNNLSVKIDTGFSERSGNYRTAFFKYHKPQIGRCYFCSYCGKILPPDRVTVDHLYPIKKAREDPRVQHKLRKMGLRDVNDPKNLVPSCAKCNAHKAAKMGTWIIRGKLGQITWLWIVRKIFRLMIILLAMYILYKNNVVGEILAVLQTYVQPLIHS